MRMRKDWITKMKKRIKKRVAKLKNSENGMVASLHYTMTQWRHLFYLEVFLEKRYMVLYGLKTYSGTYRDEVFSVAKNCSTAPAATWKDENH